MEILLVIPVLLYVISFIKLAHSSAQTEAFCCLNDTEISQNNNKISNHNIRFTLIILFYMLPVFLYNCYKTLD